MGARMSFVVALMALAAWMPAPRAANPAVEIRDPWIREAPPGAPALAGYLTLVNHGSVAVTLVGAEAAGFARAMVHRSIEQGGVAKMTHVMRLDLAPGEAVTFAPGGYHLMLVKPAHRPRAGERVPISLRFADGTSLRGEFEVREVR